MLVKTTELALRALTVMALECEATPTTPRTLADRLDCSQSYLSKTLGFLVKYGILESVRGSHGGVLLRRPPEDITLLDVLEACQGVLVPDFCLGTAPQEAWCAFHAAMRDVYDKTRIALQSWTIADLAARPVRCHTCTSSIPCKMVFGGSEHWSGWCASDETDERDTDPEPERDAAEHARMAEPLSPTP